MLANSETTDDGAESAIALKTLWTVLALSILLAGAQAYLTMNLTDLVIRAHGNAQKPVPNPEDKRTTELEKLAKPIQLEVQSVNEVEALNAGVLPRFESGN